jgi:hypothetical protein
VSLTVYSFTVISTGIDIQNCATSAIRNLSFAYSDLLNISSQAPQIAQGAAPGNIFNVFSVITSRGLQLVASFTSVLIKLTTGVPTATAQIPLCGVTAAGTAGQQLNTILANVQNCALRSG